MEKKAKKAKNAKKQKKEKKKRINITREISINGGWYVDALGGFGGPGGHR